MTRDDYGMAPLVGKGTRFLVPSLGPDSGGRVIVGTPSEVEALATYYRELAKQSAAFFSHVFVRDGIVVQINGDLPDAKATKYEKVLMGL